MTAEVAYGQIIKGFERHLKKLRLYLLISDAIKFLRRGLLSNSYFRKIILEKLWEMA